MSHYLNIFLLAAMPISELRGAIPLGILGYHLPWPKVFIAAFIGNILPIVFLLLLLGEISKIIEQKFYFLNNLWQWLLEKTRRRHQKKFAIFGSLALVVLVAIPLPLTGAWTGALAAFVFRVRFWLALFLISLGVFFAGILVTLFSLSLV